MPNQYKPEPNSARTGNRLLDLMPEIELQRLAPALSRSSWNFKQLLTQASDSLPDLVFPTTCLISTLVVMENGTQIEAGMTGREGVVGLTAALGFNFEPHQVVCQIPGEGFRLPSLIFREAIERSRQLDSLIRLYAAVVLRQTEQSVACNALHSTSDRLSRWLLRLHDQVGRDYFPMTQEILGDLLGVRRQTVTVVAGSLQAAGLITFRRGVVRIVNRSLLEEATCECYWVMREIFDSVFS